MYEDVKTCGYWYKPKSKGWRFITKTVDDSVNPAIDSSWMPSVFDGKIALAFMSSCVISDKAIKKLYRQTRKMFYVPWYKRLFKWLIQK